MSAQNPADWRTILLEHLGDSSATKTLTDKLEMMLVSHKDQPAESNSAWREERKQVDSEIERIKAKAESPKYSLSKAMCQASENAIYFGHGQNEDDIKTREPSDFAEWLFLKPLMVNLDKLVSAIDRAKQLRQWPSHGPRNILTDFWIARLAECFYQHDLQLEISHRKKSLFFRVAWDFLRELGLEEERSNLSARLEVVLESNPYASHHGGYLLTK